MKPVNPVSEKDRDIALSLWHDSDIEVEEVAQALADARSEGYVAGVEDAAKVARSYMTISSSAGTTSMGDLVADHFTEALLGPKKEGGG